jgi:hypothetical protein
LAKVRQVSEHVNLILKYIPYIQTNFVLGLDTDEGPDPFEVTKLFLNMTPGAFPAYSLLSAFGRAAPLNLDYQRSNRVDGGKSLAVEIERVARFGGCGDC